MTVHDIDENKVHKYSEVICISCYTRWTAVRESTVLLKNLECPNCGQCGFVIETGESI